MGGRPVGPVASQATFRALARPAGRARSGPFSVRWAPLDADGELTQVSYAVSKRCGGAVLRNRIRRRTKAAIRQISQGIPAGAFLITTEPEVATMEFAAMREDLESALRAAATKGVR